VSALMRLSSDKPEEVQDVTAGGLRGQAMKMAGRPSLLRTSSDSIGSILRTRSGSRLEVLKPDLQSPSTPRIFKREAFGSRTTHEDEPRADKAEKVVEKSSVMSDEGLLLAVELNQKP